jgi:tetratricopeptide (TPR) repeat protein
MSQLNKLFGRKPEQHKREQIIHSLQAFIEAKDWIASQQVLTQHPELLSDEADEALDRLITAARAQGDKKATHAFEEHRDLLRRCREIGIEKAFAEKIQESAIPVGLRIMRDRLNSLPPEQREAVGQWLSDNKNPEEIARSLNRNPLVDGALFEVFVGLAYNAMGVPLEFHEDLDQAQLAEQRYLETGDPSALDDTVATWQRILSDSHFALGSRRFQITVLNGAGRNLLQRYRTLGQQDDIDSALAACQQAINLIPADSPDRASMLTNLSTILHARYERTGNLADLHQAIEVLRYAVDLSSSSSPDRASILSKLAVRLRERYTHTSDLTDLDQAIEAYQQVINLAPGSSSDQASHLNNLAIALHDRYEQRGNLTDLQQAIETYQQAVALTPSGSPDQAAHLNNLGLALHDQYMRTGDLADLHQAIEAGRRAISLTPSDSPDRIHRLSNLAGGLQDRYTRGGNLADLQQAIEAWRQAVELTLSDSPDRAAYLNNLGFGRK